MSVKMPAPDHAVLNRRDRIVKALRAIVPGEGVIATETEMRPYESDALTAYRALPMVVVLPDTVEQVCQVLKYCNAEGIKVVPRGAGTSLSGGARGDQPGRHASGRAGRVLLRARPFLADRLHDRRQRGGKFRRRALPQI